MTGWASSKKKKKLFRVSSARARFRRRRPHFFGRHRGENDNARRRFRARARVSLADPPFSAFRRRVPGNAPDASPTASALDAVRRRYRGHAEVSREHPCGFRRFLEREEVSVFASAKTRLCVFSPGRFGAPARGAWARHSARGARERESGGLRRPPRPSPRGAWGSGEEEGARE